MEDRFKELEQARLDLLYAQRDCSWCKFHAESVDELVRHIETQHPKLPNGDRKS